MKKSDENDMVYYLVYLTLFLIIVAGGWIANIVKIIHYDFAKIGGMLVARCFGVFIVPLGTVLGFF